MFLEALINSTAVLYIVLFFLNNIGGGGTSQLVLCADIFMVAANKRQSVNSAAYYERK